MSDVPAGLRLRAYRPGDEEAINRGFAEAFSTQRPLADWSWKFAAGPEGRWIVVATAEDGEVVAQYAVVPVRVKIDGRVYRAGQPVDAYCLRRPGVIQRRGFVATVRHFYDLFGRPGEIDFIFGFPGERHMRLGALRLGYVEPVAVPLWRRRVGAQGSGRWRGVGRRVSEGVDLGAIEALWERASGRYPVAVVRSPEWVARRYTGRPGVSYRHLTVSRWGRPRAWGVVCDSGGSVRLADLLWDGSRTEDLVSLDRAVDELARSEGASEVEMWLGGDPQAAGVLENLGWERVAHPQGLQMTAVSFHPEVDGVDLVRRFYLTLGDSDLV